MSAGLVEFFLTQNITKPCKKGFTNMAPQRKMTQHLYA